MSLHHSVNLLELFDVGQRFHERRRDEALSQFTYRPSLSLDSVLGDLRIVSVFNSQVHEHKSYSSGKHYARRCSFKNEPTYAGSSPQNKYLGFFTSFMPLFNTQSLHLVVHVTFTNEDIVIIDRP